MYHTKPWTHAPTTVGCALPLEVTGSSALGIWVQASARKTIVYAKYSQRASLHRDEHMCGEVHGPLTIVRNLYVLLWIVGLSVCSQSRLKTGAG